MQALVVDDSFLMRTILTRMLEEFGFDVKTAKDDLQAMERLGEGPAAEPGRAAGSLKADEPSKKKPTRPKDRVGRGP